jgi:hypothetical protein
MNFLSMIHAAICRILNPFKVRGVVLKLILPWNEGFFIYPIDYGHDKITNTFYLTWLCVHFRIIMPFPLPPVAPKAVAPAAKAGNGGDAVAIGTGAVATGGNGGSVTTDTPVGN